MYTFYEQHKRRLEALAWLVWIVLAAFINATSVLMEYQRRGDALSVWEPFVWEFSSGLMIFALIPLILCFDRWFPLGWENIRKHLFYHIGFSVVFSLLHVIFMVMIRKGVYQLMGRHYDFGHWPAELFYEYRKDFQTYLMVIAVVYSYRFISSRLRGEANFIAGNEESGKPTFSERLLVKKLGKEFVISIHDVDWIEAAGNYINLHIGERIYPLRKTMNEMEKSLDAAKFARIHRSYIVNLMQVDHIKPQDSGDHRVYLKNGKELNLSRRYRENVKSRLRL